MLRTEEVAKFIGIALLLVLSCCYFFVKDGFSSLSTPTRSLYSIDVDKFRRYNKSSLRHSSIRKRLEPSYQCSEEEITFQFENYDLVDSHICDSEYAWLQAQNAIRDASVFIDVGGNVGYTSARMFGMWSPGHGYNRKELLKGIREDVTLKLRSEKGTLDTVCGDGSKSDIPLRCVGLEPEACTFRRKMTVYAFDGQTMHVNSTSRVVYKGFPQLHPSYTVNRENSEVKATFEYINAAVTSEVPAGVTHGYFTEVNHEGGRLEMLKKGAAQPNAGTILVPVTTVDKFCEERNIPEVDIIKVDAEGNDIAVIKGAAKTLSTRRVKMLTAEVAFNDHEWYNVVKLLDEKFGFDCYLNGRYNTMLRCTRCMNSTYPTLYSKYPLCNEGEKCAEYIKWGNRLISGNMYCVHRVHAAALAQVFFEHSLVRYANKQLGRGHLIKDGMLGTDGATFGPDGKISLRNAAAFQRYHGRNPDTGVKKWYRP